MAERIYSSNVSVLSALTRKYSCMDFWSAPENQLTVTATAGDITLPNIVVAGLPSGLTVRRTLFIITIRAIRDSSGAINYINAASKTIRIKKSTGTWGEDDMVAITFANQSLYVAASSLEQGPVIIGAANISSVVDGNATYNVMSNQTERSDAIVAKGANLLLDDVQVGFRIHYS